MLQNDPFNLIITGVGGQGNLLTAKIIGTAATDCGYKVSVGDTLGVSQRGGAVTSHIRFSNERTYGPLIPFDRAHVILGFEPLETLRALQTYGSNNTKVVLNDQPIYPLAVQKRELPYPDKRIWEEIEELSSSYITVPASEIALELNNPKIMNTVMLGALASNHLIPISRTKLELALKLILPEKIIGINFDAFEKGFNFAPKI